MLKQEWKSLFHNKILLLVVIVIALIPAIYAGLFLASMWDPYGNVDKLPVAIVNEDEPAEYGDTTLTVGEQLVDNLKENDSLAFNFVDEDVANEGLKNGTYYMVITIPKDFSANAATMMDEQPQKMILNYETNPGTNYIASKLSETALGKCLPGFLAGCLSKFEEDCYGTFYYSGKLSACIIASRYSGWYQNSERFFSENPF